jgi:hypothetical protein
MMCVVVGLIFGHLLLAKSNNMLIESTFDDPNQQQFPVNKFKDRCNAFVHMENSASLPIGGMVQCRTTCSLVEAVSHAARRGVLSAKLA